MYELILVGSGFLAGIVIALALFKFGMSYATKFIYQIKEDIPLEQIGKPYESEFDKTD